MTERVELWIRSMSSWTVGREGTFVDDIEELVDAGVVDDYEVTMWNDHVPVEPERELTRREALVRDRVDAIREWADEQGYELPAFSRSKKVRGFDGPSYEATVLPLAVLIGFDDGAVEWMAPYSDGETHVSVQDRLDELSAAADEVATAEPAPEAE